MTRTTIELDIPDDPAERVRREAEYYDLRAAFYGDDVPRKNIALRKAHDKILALSTENDRLREALEKLANLDAATGYWTMREIARAALSPAQKGG